MYLKLLKYKQNLQQWYVGKTVQMFVPRGG